MPRITRTDDFLKFGDVVLDYVNRQTDTVEVFDH